LNVGNPTLGETFGALLMQFQTHLAECRQGMIDAWAVPPAPALRDGAVLLTSLAQGIAMRWRRWYQAAGR
jgi:hypothetical protein